MLTDRPPRKCLHPGCPNIGNWVNHGGRCPEHEAQVKGRRVRPMEKLYALRSYKDRHVPRMRSCNPICQRIEDGAQCTHYSEVLHHLKEARTPAEFFDPRNAVMLCKRHHPNSPGTPAWVEGQDYVPTVYTAPSLGSLEDVG